MLPKHHIIIAWRIYLHFIYYPSTPYFFPCCLHQSLIPSQNCFNWGETNGNSCFPRCILLLAGVCVLSLFPGKLFLAAPFLTALLRTDLSSAKSTKAPHESLIWSAEAQPVLSHSQIFMVSNHKCPLHQIISTPQCELRVGLVAVTCDSDTVTSWRQRGSGLGNDNR